MDAALRSLRFRQEREETWKRLEALLKRVEGGRAGSLSDEDMLALPALYRATLSSLSVARATSLDAALVDYLEALSARAYFFVYGARATFSQRIGKFFAEDWPNAVRAMWRETIASLLITLLTAALGWHLVADNPEWYFSFVPHELASGRDPSATEEFLRGTLYPEADIKRGLTILATFLFTNNAGVAIFAFALGIAFCVPSVLLLAHNGLMLGAMFQVFAAKGLGYEFGGWVMIHGFTELFAIVLAGAAGLRVGCSLAFPGNMTRLQAAERAGRQGGVAMIGVVLMLFIAALLEGFARQLITIDAARWAVAGLSAVLWLTYFYFGRRRSAPDG